MDSDFDAATAIKEMTNIIDELDKKRGERTAEERMTTDAVKQALGLESLSDEDTQWASDRFRELLVEDTKEAIERMTREITSGTTPTAGKAEAAIVAACMMTIAAGRSNELAQKFLGAPIHEQMEMFSIGYYLMTMIREVRNEEGAEQ